MTASLLGASFEAFLLDDEMNSYTYRALHGIDATDENLGFDAIREAVLGDRHLLGLQHTYVATERDYFLPSFPRQSQGTAYRGGRGCTHRLGASTGANAENPARPPAILSHRRSGC